MKENKRKGNRLEMKERERERWGRKMDVVCKTSKNNNKITKLNKKTGKNGKITY